LHASAPGLLTFDQEPIASNIAVQASADVTASPFEQPAAKHRRRIGSLAMVMLAAIRPG
jgi:hypothetical protein